MSETFSPFTAKGGINGNVNITSGPGTATRELSEYLTDIISVKDYGAKGDGTTDDSSAITQSMANPEVYVPEGTYIVNSNSFFVQNTTKFMGPGKFSYNGNVIPIGSFITQSVTLPVPSVFPQPNNALGFLNGKVFGDGVSINIQIADGTYSGWGTIVPIHPQGDQINLLGDVTDRDNVVVQVDQTNANKFFMISNARFGIINGMTILGIKGWESTGVWDESITPYGGAIWADHGGTCTVGAQVFIQKMYYGIRADHNSSILVQPGVLVNEYGDVGYHAYGGGSILCSGTFADTGGHVSVGLGAGYMAEFGGKIQAEQASSANAHLYGICAISNGTAWALGCTISNAGMYGAWAQNGGHTIVPSFSTTELTNITGCKYGIHAGMWGSVEANSAVVQNSTEDGINCNSGSIDATNATTKNNGGSGAIVRNNGIIWGTWTSTGNTNADTSNSGGILNADPTL